MPRPEITTEDLLDTDEMPVLDMTKPGPTSQIRIAIPGREFDYDETGRSLDFERFMNEALVVSIVEPTDDNAPPAVHIGINGDMKWLPRGYPIRIQRSYVERLAASIESWYAQDEERDMNADQGFRTRTRKRACYPLQILRDPSPALGRKWLARVIREGS